MRRSLIDYEGLEALGQAWARSIGEGQGQQRSVATARSRGHQVEGKQTKSLLFKQQPSECGQEESECGQEESECKTGIVITLSRKLSRHGVLLVACKLELDGSI